MALYKIKDFNPNYREEAFDGEDIKGLNVYAGRTEEKIGTIHDALVDDSGRFRYLVIDTGFWIFGKKVLLPVGRCQVDARAQRVYATGITSKDQAEHLPEYDDSMTVDYDYEERVRGVYRTPTTEASLPVEMSPPVEASGIVGATPRPAPRPTPQPSVPDYDRSTYTYDREPDMYTMNEQNHQKFRLYEERLVANKHRQKTGDVIVGKHVETEAARASIPVEKERVVVERHNPTGASRAATPGEANFREGQVARMELYEETAEIGKQAYVREEVDVRKEVQRDTVEANETLRHEELDVDIKGKPVVDRNKRV